MSRDDCTLTKLLLSYVSLLAERHAQSASQYPLPPCGVKPTVFGEHPTDQHPEPYSA
jgi:hypothetical protein